MSNGAWQMPANATRLLVANGLLASMLQFSSLHAEN
jgi:hypothetical protein